MVTNSKIKWIVFDCFGVISSEVFWPWIAKVDPNWKTREAEYDALCKQGDCGAITTDQYTAQLSNMTGLKPEEIFPAKEKEVVINGSVIELIKTLKPTYKIGMITDAHAYFVKKIILDNDLNQYFDKIIISSDVKTTKAMGPKIFEIFMAQTGISPSEMIFIDNAQKNVALATSLGIKSLLFQNFEQLAIDLQTSLS